MGIVADLKRRLFRWQSDGTAPLRLAGARGVYQRLAMLRLARGDARAALATLERGRTWTDVRIVPELFDAPCMASVLRVETGGRGRLLFSGPTKSGRRDGALWSSEDGGATWRRCAAIRDGPFAYSCLVSLPDGPVGCLYETGEQGCYERIDFARLPMPGTPARDTKP